MSAKILHFDQQFDATRMSPRELCDEVRRRGWASFSVDTHRALFGDGKLIATRLNRKEANRGS